MSTPPTLPLPLASVPALLAAGREVAFPPPSANETAADRTARTVPADWLADLVANADMTCTVPITIRNAIIQGTLTCRGAVFKHYVILTDCEFDAEVTLNFSRFERSLILTGSVFRASVGARGVDVAGDLILAGSTFSDASLFSDAHVSHMLDASGATFAETNFE